MSKERIMQETINLVLRQTNYEEDYVKKQLELNDYDPFPIINEYMGIQSKSQKKETVNINQQIYKSFRNKLSGNHISHIPP